MAVFVLHYAVFGADPILVPRLLFACAMIVLFAIDLEHHLLPERDHASGHRRWACCSRCCSRQARWRR